MSQPEPIIMAPQEPIHYPLLERGTDSGGGEQALGMTNQPEPGYVLQPRLRDPIYIWFQPFDHFGDHGSPKAERKAFKVDRGCHFFTDEVFEMFPGYNFYADMEGSIKRVPSVLSGEFIEANVILDRYYSKENHQWYFREPTIKIYKRRAPPVFVAARWTVFIGLLVALFFCVRVWLGFHVQPENTLVRTICGLLACTILNLLAPAVAVAPWTLSEWKMWELVKTFANPRNLVVLLKSILESYRERIKNM